jgi:hypothetical protein
MLEVKKVEDTKEVIRSNKSKDRQYHGQEKEYKQLLQNNTQKIKDRATRTLLTAGRVNGSCSACDIRCVTVQQHEHHLI